MTGAQGDLRYQNPKNCQIVSLSLCQVLCMTIKQEEVGGGGVGVLAMTTPILSYLQHCMWEDIYVLAMIIHEHQTDIASFLPTYRDDETFPYSILLLPFIDI